MKKLLSALLAAVLAAGLIPASVYAAGASNPSPAEAQSSDDGEFLIEAPRLKVDIGTAIPEGLFSLQQTSSEQYIRAGESFTFELVVDNTKLTDPNLLDDFVPGIANFQFTLVLEDIYGYPLEGDELTDLVELTNAAVVSDSPADVATSQVDFSSSTMTGGLSSDEAISGAAGKASYLGFTVKIRDDASIATGLNQDYKVYLRLTTVSFIYPGAGGASNTLYSFGEGQNASTTEAGGFTVTPETDDFRVFAHLTPTKEVVGANETFEVAFYLDEGTQFACIEGYFDYDPDLLTLTGCEWGFTDSVRSVNNLDLGKIGFTIQQNGYLTAGTDPIFTATFQSTDDLVNATSFDIQWVSSAFYPVMPLTGSYERRVVAEPKQFSVDLSTIYMRSDVSHEVLMVDDTLVVTLTIPCPTRGLGVRELTGTLAYDHDVLEWTDTQWGWNDASLSHTYSAETGALNVHTVDNTYFPIPANTSFLTLTFNFKNSAAAYGSEGSTSITWTQSTFDNDSAGTAQETATVALRPITLRILRMCLGNVDNNFTTVNGETVPLIDSRDYITLMSFMNVFEDEETQRRVAKDHAFLDGDGVKLNYYNINACVSGGTWTEGRLPTPAELINLGTYVVYGGNSSDETFIADGYDNLGN